MGNFILMGGVINAFIQPNMTRLPEEIWQGTLDFALIKPADAQGLISIRIIKTWSSNIESSELPGLPHPMQQAGIEDFKPFRVGATGSGATPSVHALPELHPHV